MNPKSRILTITLISLFFLSQTKVKKKDQIELFLQKGHIYDIRSVTFSPDGKKILSASDDKTIKIWDISGRLLHTFEGHSDWVRSVTFSSDGKKILSASDDKTIKLWDISGKLLHTFEGHSNGVRSVTFSSDGKKILSASGDKTIKL